MTAIAESPILTEPGIYDIPEDLYHADPVPGGSLSSTGARKLLPPSCPARFRYEQLHPAAPSAAMELGTAAHKLILGTGPELVVVDAADWRTNAAKDQAAEARGRGAVPLLRDDYARVQAMAAAIRSHRLASALLSPERGGHPEQSLFAVDDYTGVWCRSRLDWMPDPESPRPVIADYKSAASADPGAFTRSVSTYGYHVQEFWYRRLYAQLTGVDAEFVFIVQEKTPPYVVTVCRLDDESVRAGGTLARQALERYRDCMESGIWPAHSDEIERISLPRWAMPREDY